MDPNDLLDDMLAHERTQAHGDVSVMPPDLQSFLGLLSVVQPEGSAIAVFVPSDTGHTATALMMRVNSNGGPTVAQFMGMMITTYGEVHGKQLEAWFGDQVAIATNGRTRNPMELDAAEFKVFSERMYALSKEANKDVNTSRGITNPYDEDPV
jgi:hypothetical protein